jgi:hypothetical protein
MVAIYEWARAKDHRAKQPLLVEKSSRKIAMFFSVFYFLKKAVHYAYFSVGREAAVAF